MGKINVLDFEIANLIAAGEVVERPSSVLKELIENSIDSGATRIVAEIKRGGIAMISVTDNGCGIDKEDLPVALKRHATSKIKTREDLDGIMTLGFRGEALAAISSVSVMTIITKTREAEVGTMLTAEGGKVTDISEVGTSDGTTVVVEDLFYNVPARRKFLKKDSTEAMNVTALVEKVALSRPDISIQLRIDGVEKFNTAGDGNLENTIYSIFGKEFASKLIACDGRANGVRVHGFIGRSDNVRKNRNLENFFINGRYVKSLTAMAALEKAYTSYIAPECFPACVLFLEMNPQIVDVNVHPAKLEVKFANEQPVFEAVYYTVKRALEDSEYRPDMQLANRPSAVKNPLSAFVPIGANTKGEQIQMQTQSVPVNTPISVPKAPAYSKGLDAPIRVGSGVGDGLYAKTARAVEHSAEITPKRSIDILNAYANAAPRTPKQ
jgi:DNA mismatch repair protein MutL